MRPRPTDEREKSRKATSAPAEQVSRLEGKVKAQQETVRMLLAQAKAMEASLRQAEDLANEITALKHEIRELTRANRDQVRRYELLRSENERLRSRSSAKRAAA